MTATTKVRDDRRVGPEAIAAHADVIDVRTPSEFAEDHVPGAINRPVLSDEERAIVGTLHAKASAFEAKKLGAALISRNIAGIVDGLRDRPREFAPLVYCWRGGQRSRSLAHVMNEIGWRAVQLDGGYRAYRRHVCAALEALPARCSYRVICGLTGSGKSRLLAALAREGAQTLDLEGLARHRGSLLGDLPGRPAAVAEAVREPAPAGAARRSIPRDPVFVESESKKIGRLQVPESLLATMRGSPCVRVDLSRPMRIALLEEEYAHFLADPALLGERLAPLVPLHGKATIERWGALSMARDFDALVEELLVSHYDPVYARSIERNFPRYEEAIVVAPEGIDEVRLPSCRAATDRGCGRVATMTAHAFRLVNVFAEAPLAGNPLCVFEDGRGLDDATMQALALQFNLSETTFVLPSSRASAHVRIFTPTFEMPFAGHPTLGTAHVVRALAGGGDRVTLEMKAGVIPVEAQGDVWTLQANAPTHRRPAASRAELAAMLGLREEDVLAGSVVGRHR